MFEIRIAIAAFSVSVGLVAHAQSPPATGVYQITSGRYIACCGIAGPSSQNLPNSAQRFVDLTVHPTTSSADMRILAEDMRTVLRASSGLDSFTYAFSNGVVMPNGILFENFLPFPGQTRYKYTISNSADTLRINGSVELPFVCCDTFTQFRHTNTVAVLMPTIAIRVSQVEVCWNSVSNLTYQVQYRSSPADTWTNLGDPIPGNDSTNCIKDDVLSGQSHRLYRVINSP
jgi:hypothetical protein